MDYIIITLNYLLNNHFIRLFSISGSLSGFLNNIHKKILYFFLKDHSDILQSWTRKKYTFQCVDK